MNQKIINEALNQLTKITWDGDLISKDARDWLKTQGLVERGSGFNWLTSKGVEYCVTLKILKP